MIPWSRLCLASTSIPKAGPRAFNTAIARKQTNTRVPAWRIWLLAGRVPTLTAGAIPVVLGTAAAIHTGTYRAGVFWPTLVSSLLIQLGTNLINDYFDYCNGADLVEEGDLARVLPAGLLTPRQVATASIVSFTLAVAFGLYLVFTGGGWPILSIGLSCIAAGVLYTGGPWPLGYHGWGDFLTFTFFGMVAVNGTFFLHAGKITLLPLALSIPVGFLVTAILVANNLRDVKADQAVGKYTLAVQLGATFGRIEYISLVLLSFLVPPLLWFAGLASPSILVAWLTLPLAVLQMRGIVANYNVLTLHKVVNQTALLHLLFGFSLAVSLLL